MPFNGGFGMTLWFANESIGPSDVIHRLLRLIACDRCCILMPNLATRLALLIVRRLRL
jgi:hypothetical protein